MFDALIDGEDREITRAREPPVIEERLQRTQDARRAVGRRPDAINEVGAGELQLIFGDGLRGVVEQSAGVRAEQFFDFTKGRTLAFEFGCHKFQSSYWK
jgi:hypothetical protein